MATYTTIPFSDYNAVGTSDEIKQRRSKFYVQGGKVIINIPAPTDKTVQADYNFTYTCDIAASYIESVVESGNISYIYNNSFSDYSQTNITMTEIIKEGNNYKTFVLPRLDYDAAFRIICYVKDDLSGNVAYQNKLIIYAYRYTTNTTRIISSGFDNDEKLNLQIGTKLIGPRLKNNGAIEDNYYSWFNNNIIGSGWSTYIHDIYISKNKITTPTLPPADVTPTLRITAMLDENHLDGSSYIPYIDSRTFYRKTTLSDTLSYSPDGSSRTITSNANVTLAWNSTSGTDAYTELIITITGLTGFSVSNGYNIKIETYNTSSTKNARAYLSTIDSKISPSVPIMQLKDECVQITTVKTQSKNGALVVNNISSNENILDSIAILGTGVKTWTDPNSHAYHLDSYPSIGFYNSSGQRYFIIDLSAEEATAWRNLIGHA